MLSTKAVKNIEQAAHYFLGTDNYYTEGNSLAQEYSQWWGKGAQALDLSGPVDPQLFTALLQGHLPGGQLGKKVDGEIIHRPGFDLTFSVPKSVSILALLGEDQRPAVGGILTASARRNQVARFARKHACWPGPFQNAIQQPPSRATGPNGSGPNQLGARRRKPVAGGHPHGRTQPPDSKDV